MTNQRLPCNLAGDFQDLCCSLRELAAAHRSAPLMTIVTESVVEQAYELEEAGMLSDADEFPQSPGAGAGAAGRIEEWEVIPPYSTGSI